MVAVRIPAERVAVLIGASGEIKKLIEERGKVKLTTDRDGAIEITGKDPVLEWKVKDVVKAIGRGFSPQKALRLFSDEYYLKIIDLKQMLGSENEIIRQKGRVIGKDGRAREILEELTEADICVYGNTISIIGKLEEITIAEAAVLKILGGASHSRTYTFLERERKRMKEESKLLWEEKK